MPWAVVVNRILQNGRLAFRRTFLQGKHGKDVVDGQFKSIPNTRAAVSTAANQGQRSGLRSQLRQIFVDNILSRVTNTLSTQLRRTAARKLLFGDSAPFFALVGVSLASGTGIITKEEEMEGICFEIREAVSKLKCLQTSLKIAPASLYYEEPVVTLDDLEIGPSIAKGCSAVVYSGKWKDTSLDADVSTATKAITEDPSDSTTSYPLAVKMMFNYNAESNALSILRAMYRETVPAHKIATRDLDEWEQSLQSRKKTLPPHPNIVDMYCVFADEVPSFPDSMALYPDALPHRLNPEGCGRNMSLFLVMKRYDTSLQQYLKSRQPGLRTSIYILTQLLEGVAHLNRHEVAHRDLKSDNILLDLAYGTDTPIVAITDFGCCLADKVHKLYLPYQSPETDKGGNPALMAPEVACATAGSFTNINYSNSDVWTVGALAYEIFGLTNPFYGDSKRLDSRHFSQSQLPPLPENVPPLLQEIILGLLQRNPGKRPTAEFAATICQLFLWAPTSWLKEESGDIPSSTEIMQWLLCLTTKVLCETIFPHSRKGQEPVLEYRLIATFLHRIKLANIVEALVWIRNG